MIAAIYARKSTEQHGADADAKSVIRQVENARAFARTKGWRVPEAHVYTDDAISGAETRKLVNRQRLLDALASDTPPFQVVIMRDASRFSRRDGDEAFGELKRIAQSGVEIWFYQEAARFAFGTFGDNVVGFVRAEMNAEYRRQIARFTKEAMVRKAQAGYVTGGSVFGYDNVRVDGHVERRINEAQAEVVRRIFALCAAGTGYTRIAKQLNAERVPAPRPQRARPAGWSPSTVYEVLHRPLYRGEVIWNKTRKRDAQGNTAVSSRPETEWLLIKQPNLRVVAEDVWMAAHARLAQIRARLTSCSGSRPGRRRRDIDSQYWLSGFARCETCGGTLATMNRRTTGRQRVFVYGCLAHHKRGTTACTNALVKPIASVDAAVQSQLVADVLRPRVVRAILDGVFAAMQPQTAAKSVGVLTRSLATLDTKIAHLTTAIENGAAVAPLVSKLQERQAERDVLVAEIGAAEAMQDLAVDRQKIERQVLAKVGNWRGLLDGNISERRQFLREVLDGPIYFKPEGDAYRFTGQDRRGRLITDLVTGSTILASPRGTHTDGPIRIGGSFRAA